MRILRRRAYPNPQPLRWPNSPDGDAGAGQGPERGRRRAIRLAQHQVPQLTTLTPDPPHGVIPPTPPGPEGSKGTRALTGVRGVPYSPVRMS
jgi:hypothetical protein